MRLIDIAKLWRIPRTIVCKTIMYQNNYQMHLEIPDSTKTYILGYMEIFVSRENDYKLSYFSVEIVDSVCSTDRHLIFCEDHARWKQNRLP